MNWTGDIKQMAHSDLAKNSAKLLSANVIAQVIGLLVYPLLTRLYSPEDFGLFNLFMSIGGIIVLLATAEYQYSVMLPKDKKDAVACFHVGFFVLIGVTAVCAFAAIFSEPIADLFKTPQLADFFPLISVFVLFSGLWTLLNYWYTRNKQFGNISTYQLTQSVSNAGLKYGFGLSGMLRGGLIFSSVIGSIVSLIVSLTIHFKQEIRPLLSFDKLRSRTMAKTYGNFPKFSLPRALINQSVGQLPTLLLVPFFGQASIGYWGMAILLAFTPISTMTRAFYQVLYKKTTDLVNGQLSIRPLLIKFLTIIAGSLLVGFLVLYPLLPIMTEWLLGAEWEIVGHYIRYMLPWLFVSSMVASIGFLADIFFKQKQALYYEILLAVLRIAGLLIGIAVSSFEVAIAGYAIGSAVAVTAQLVWLLRMISSYEKRLG